ncbi:hypothetical protein [Polluticoccus soli]|uniref:hypothetical protein n=1 Tax=Polluticoccus soli TaxID=3034150 RepID=UPI0023E16C5C|nr:hypothetical protein [Flavipsychrobacter sp. JY13-12]
MKKYCFILLALLYATTGWSQGKVWLPELFVQHALAGDAAEQYLRPFEFIFDPPDSGLVWTYGAPQASRVDLRLVSHEGREKWQVLYLANHFYRNVNPREYIDGFYGSMIYLSRHGQKLRLEIIKDDKTETIDFVDRANGQIFIDGKKAIKQLRQNDN